MSDENVVSVDFGAGARAAAEEAETRRKFDRLHKLVQAWEADFAANPRLYYDELYDEVVRLRKLIRTAWEAGTRTPPPLTSYTRDQPPLGPTDWQTVVVERGDFDRMKAMAEIINAEVNR